MIIKKKIVEQDIQFPKGSKISEEAKDLVYKMLMKNPEKRINIFDIKSHYWILGTKLYGIFLFNLLKVLNTVLLF